MSLHLTPVEGAPPVSSDLARAIRPFSMHCDHLDGWVSEITAHETALMIIVTHTPSARAWRAMKPDITEAVLLSRRIVAEQRAKETGAPVIEATQALLMEEPDEAPGLTVEPHESVGDDKQPRLSNGMGQG
jgi:hypothetical protein